MLENRTLHRPSRSPGRHFVHRSLAAAALAVALTPLTAPSGADAATAAAAAAVTSASPSARAAETYMVGRGIADVTGSPGEVPLMGYADSAQTSRGLVQRQWARAFVVVDQASGRRVAHVNLDIWGIPQSVRDAVLGELQSRFGTTYDEQNVMLAATHTHGGSGGFSHHSLYNLSSGFQGQTFRAIVDGTVRAIARADADLAPASLSLATSELDNASAQRSRAAFDRNPAADRAVFPTGTDTRNTTLRVSRGGSLVGAINWFAVHGTSMSHHNRHISPDNMGYAEYRWEHLERGVDSMDPTPDFVASFAQTTPGDMSPNLNLRPTDGPTRNEYENTRIIGERMYAAARRGGTGRPVLGTVDSRLIYVNMADVEVAGRFTPDGQPHRTCPAAFGASFAAGSTEDGGGAPPGFNEGDAGGGNPLIRAISEALYTADPALRACQAPKDILLPAGSLDLVQQRLPVQLMRIGSLYIVGIPGEPTIVSGLRLRRAVAAATGASIDQVIVQGYANGYSHYVTTPEEYDSQEYEGGSTMFGRYTLPAYVQTVDRLAVAMRSGTPLDLGAKERDRSAEQLPPTSGTVLLDVPQLGHRFGDVLTQPQGSYARGAEVRVVFAGAHPNNNLRTGGTYVSVERQTAAGWTRVANDNDWETEFDWARDGLAASKVTVRWAIPTGTAAGTYRIRYFGDARQLSGLVAISGTSHSFDVD